jgi:GWxTD domain-containing protein
MSIKKIFTYVLFLSCTLGLHSILYAEIPFAGYNVAHYYNPKAEVQLQHQIARGKHNATIYFKLSFINSHISDNYQIWFELHPDYQNFKPVFVEKLTQEKHLTDQDMFQHYYYKLEIPLELGYNLGILRVKNTLTNQDYLFDIQLSSRSAFPFTDLIIMEETRDIPIFNRFISAEKNFRIFSVYDTTQALYFYHYTHHFHAADPPMGNLVKKIDKEMKIDSSFAVKHNQKLRLNHLGLYFVQKDTNSAEGISFRITDPHYPRYVKAEDLLSPLLYISTASERKKILEATDHKKELDRYWLGVTNSPEKAKKIIRNYYKQVELANTFFSNYKEGWKTDKGIVFLILGPPDEVYISEEKEEWIYNKKEHLSKIRFTFVRVKNIFSHQHYELVRQGSYEKIWFKIIDLWRKGRKEI